MMLRAMGCTLLASLAASAMAASDLFDGFRPGWREHWQEKKFFTRPTLYSVVEEAGQLALHATSHAAHAGLARRVECLAPTASKLRWRWKIKNPLANPHDERSRAGDDYVARVFVVFEESIVPLRTRAINYVWAAREAPGSVFMSPYTKNVGMCVLRSGSTEAGQWLAEERDPVVDYQQFFGERPRRISAVAVLVDTDNTGLEGEAWFAALELETNPPAVPK